MASLKQAQYVREQYPDAEVTIYYIDLRTPGRYENFVCKILFDENVHVVKGKVAAVTRDKAGNDVWVTVEDAVSETKSVKFGVSKRCSGVILETICCLSWASTAACVFRTC